jgi:prevent-host-death family protein
MEKVGSYEAKTHLPRLLERVSKGERFTITRNGVPVAELVPTSSDKKPEVQAVIEAMERFQESGPTLGPDLTIKELIGEGRRF